VVPAVILAAGLGQRIAHRTGGSSKALLEVGGRSLLERSLDALEAAGFGEVIVVTGHAAEAVRPVLASRTGRLTVTERWNPRYATANNIASVLAVEDMVGDGFCLLNSDIVFDPSIVLDMVAVESGSWLVVDRDEPLGDEEMKVMLDEADTLSRISKALDPRTSAGEYIGICRFDARGTAVLMASAHRLVDAGGTNLYYEDATDAAATALAMRVVWTRHRAWTEIDDETDYRRAVDVAARLDGRP
jgi:choline kinase